MENICENLILNWQVSLGELAQRNYDEKLLSEVEKQLKNIQNIIKKYEKQEIVQVEELYSVYDRMSPSRKKWWIRG